MKKTYMHTGIPVAAKMPGMNYMKSLRVWIGYNKDFDIEYLYWEKETPMAYRGVAETHVAYKVDSVAKACALKGQSVILPPFDIGNGHKIAYVSVKNGPVVEYFE